MYFWIDRIPRPFLGIPALLLGLLFGRILASRGPELLFERIPGTFLQSVSGLFFGGIVDSGSVLGGSLGSVLEGSLPFGCFGGSQGSFMGASLGCLWGGSLVGMFRGLSFVSWVSLEDAGVSLKSAACPEEATRKLEWLRAGSLWEFL